MRIEHLSIINFGKLHNISIDFSEDLNVICENNGWGKSTIAAFIRVMLYGFEGESKRDDINCERKRYMPWQGGVYGGSLSFSVDGCSYVVSRIFGEKASLDKFELRYADTNLLCDKFSDNLGRDLFSIDSDSFMRTCFIKQNDVAYSGTTGDINSKLGNIEDVIDLNRFQIAYDSIKDRINELSPSRKTGEIYKLKANLSSLKADYDLLGTVEKDLLNNQNRLNALSEEIESTKKSIGLLRDEKIRNDNLRRQKDAREHYDELINELNERKSLYDNELNNSDIYKDTILTRLFKSDEQKDIEAELDDVIALSKQLEHIESEVAKYSVSNADKETLSRLSCYEKLKKPVDTLADCISKSVEIQETKNRLAVLQDKISSDKDKIRKMLRAKRTNGIKILLSLLIIAGSTCVWISINRNQAPVYSATYYSYLAVYIVCLVVSLLAVIALAYRSTKYTDMVKQCEYCYEEDSLEISSMTRIIQESEQIIERVIVTVNHDFDSQNYDLILNDLYLEACKYEELKAKADSYDKVLLINDYYNTRNKVSSFLYKCGITGSDRTEELLRLRGRLRLYKEKEIQLKNFDLQISDIKAKIKDYEDRYPEILLFKADSEIIDDEYFVEKEAELFKMYDNNTEERENEKKRLDRLLKEQEKKQQIEDKMHEVNLTIKEKSLLYDRLLLTQEFLVKAKENLTATYMEPLLKGFTKYYALLTGEDSSDYKIDANSVITKESHGIQRSTVTLSNGLQDLVGLCMRLAVSDVMYPEEKPVLILDDPFVNLDDITLIRARDFLDKIRHYYQVIYITCSNSRI